MWTLRTNKPKYKKWTVPRMGSLRAGNVRLSEKGPVQLKWPETQTGLAGEGLGGRGHRLHPRAGSSSGLKRVSPRTWISLRIRRRQTPLQITTHSGTNVKAGNSPSQACGKQKGFFFSRFNIPSYLKTRHFHDLHFIGEKTDAQRSAFILNLDQDCTVSRATGEASRP